ncbi:orotidine-5'-phosphate decarboxylase [Thermoproteota archaeon]
MVRDLVQRNMLIHALDGENMSKSEFLKIARDVEPYVDAIKISTPIIFEYGGAIVSELKKATTLPIIGCFKVGDIPDMSERIVKSALKSGVDGLTLHPVVGDAPMKKCIEAAHKENAYVFMVVEMSHPNNPKYEIIKRNAPLLVEMANELGSDGIVAPATKPEVIAGYRKLLGNDKWIMSPGVGHQGGHLGDAILAGANFEVIGHRIYGAPNPKEAAKEYCTLLKKRIENKNHLIAV